MAEGTRAKPSPAWGVGLAAAVSCALTIFLVAAPSGGSGLALAATVTVLVTTQVVLFQQRARRTWLWSVAAMGLLLVPALPISLAPAVPPDIGIKLCLLAAWSTAALALIGSRPRTGEHPGSRPWERLATGLGIGAVLLTGITAVSGTHEVHAYVYNESCEGVLIPLEDQVIVQVAYDDEDPRAQFLENGRVTFDAPRYYKTLAVTIDIPYENSRDNLQVVSVARGFEQYRGLLVSVLSLGIVNNNDPGLTIMNLGGAECPRGDMRGGDDLDVGLE